VGRRSRATPPEIIRERHVCRRKRSRLRSRLASTVLAANRHCDAVEARRPRPLNLFGGALFTPVSRGRARHAYRPDQCDRWDIGQRVTPRPSLWIAICRRKRAYHSLQRSTRLRHLLGDEPSGPS
jgi:hypothetical protein